MKMVKMIQSCGVAALSVHGRTPGDGNNEKPNDEELIKEISKSLDIPVFANGSSLEVHSRADADSFRYFWCNIVFLIYE